MAKRKKKQPEDTNLLAFEIVEEATAADESKNPAAVALGKLGGKKGGLARAKKLSKKRRQEIARQAAAARWAKK